MKPSSYPHEVFTEDNASAPNNHEEQPEDIAQPWQLAGNCPENTIPIKRITKEDLLRVDDIKTYGKKYCCSNISQPHQFYHPTDIKDDNGHEVYICMYTICFFLFATYNYILWNYIYIFCSMRSHMLIMMFFAELKLK